MIDAVRNGPISAKKMIKVCEYLHGMFSSESYNGIIHYLELASGDKELAEEFYKQYVKGHTRESEIMGFEDEGEKQAFIASRGQGDWYDEYQQSLPIPYEEAYRVNLDG
jgi:hypothetical protein